MLTHFFKIAWRNLLKHKTFSAINLMGLAIGFLCVLFIFFFLDEEFDRQYRAEQKSGEIVGAFSFLAIFLACLGLFGLAAYSAEQRTKEIGIRKVLGATVTNIMALLSKDFVKLVVIANFCAWPLAYLAMNRWL